MGKNNRNLEFVHGDLYGEALKVVKNFVSKSGTRPILQYSQHKANGDILATDSHRAIHIKNIHGFKEEYLIEPKNHMIAKGHYPDLINIIQRTETHLPVVVLNKEQIKLWYQLFKSISQTIKIMKENIRLNHVTLLIKPDLLQVEFLSSKTRMTLPFELLEKPIGLEKVSFQASYMMQALEAHHKLESEKLTIYFNGQMRPFIMDDDSKVITVVLPVRTTNNDK